ncbi:MAG: hypothetical protein FJ291_07025 [Planctomycetes bacterium]|nr:hypothetical protein [Planctomycetota bacterium]
MSRSTLIFLACLSAMPVLGAQQFVTEPFPAEARGAILRFDLKPLPPGTNVLRAILRVPTQGHRHGAAVRLAPEGVANAEPLRSLPPDHVSFDATAAAKAWAADPKANEGLRIADAGGVDFAKAVLEVSYLGEGREPIKPVTGLKAIHQSGQTFLTWTEIEDLVGDDAPRFEDFDRAVLGAPARRRLAYRVYRHTEPITIANLGQAELAREVPEVVTAWNLKAIRNTEHPNQGTPTKNSPLRPGYNLALNHAMTRYRITGVAQASSLWPTGKMPVPPGNIGEPLPRATGLAVSTATKPARHYYAVTAAIDGREAAAELASLKEPVDEKPSTFPAIVYQRTIKSDPKQTRSCDIDVYNSWIEPPLNNVPTVSETFIVRWKDLPAASAESRQPLMLRIGTYGCTATEAASPGWHDARRHVKGAPFIALSEGGLWQGFHDCIGTLRGYDDGVVCNYPQRRVLAAAAWAVAEPGLFIDPERVSLWAQMGGWALRHGEVFSAVMSEGHCNFAIGKVPQQHGWKWGPYPKGAKNWLGIDQWEYMDLPKWIRENPTVELPYWLCWPAYGAYPAHTVGDFGFMPWPEMIHAMAVTKRAFAANWSTNGPGPVGPLRDLVPRVRLRQSLPAFSNCSVDHSPGDGDHDDAEKGGGINLYQLWDPETLVDEPARWEITLYLRDDCPYPDLTTDLTPRRCQKVKAKPGDAFKWTHSSVEGNKELGAGTATADKWGLVTIQGLRLTKLKSRLAIARR